MYLNQAFDKRTYNSGSPTIGKLGELCQIFQMVLGSHIKGRTPYT